MVRAAAGVLLLAIVALVATSALWLRAATAERGTSIDGRVDPEAALAALAQSDTAATTIDVTARYQGRLDLLDPRNALPRWHEYDRDDAARVHRALRSCPPTPLGARGTAEGALHPDLAKAWNWHARTCAPGGTASEDLIERPPFVHPSGRSYAALAIARGGVPASFGKDHARGFHVLELAAINPALLDREDRALAAISANAWQALARGDRIVLTPRSLVVAERGQLGLSRLRVHERATWDELARASALALTPRSSREICARPASPDLCWRSLSPVERHRGSLLAATSGAAALAVLSSLALGLAYAGERRRMHADRVHVLRTLTHELRNPATSLRLDIEPLRASYDRLPESCQEPLLRISEDIERLHRVLHRSARYMALFETTAGAPHRGQDTPRLVRPSDVPSVKEMLEDFAEEWPEGAALEAGGADRPVRTDTDWLSVALRNLVENAVRHGEPPVTVTWRIERDELVVRVADRGETPRLSLRRAVAPHERDARSGGLGLGLAIVDRVARLLGGRLAHEPSPTVFELRVPVGAEKERAA